jgi:chorismate mutase
MTFLKKSVVRCLLSVDFFYFCKKKMRDSFDIKRWIENPDELLVIAGPCSVESREQFFDTATKLSELHQIKILRGGIWKPRTRPNGFEGIGEDGLKWMKEFSDNYGLPFMTEVATPEHVELALKYNIDALWIGARTVANPFSVQQLADALRGTDMPIFIKNPIAADLKLWIGAFERLSASGLRHLVAIHRGFQDTNAAPFRNNPRCELPIELHRKNAYIPIITDISHICGCRDILQKTAQKALDLATNGLMIESHCEPKNALTDAEQQITPEDLKSMLDKLVIHKSKSPNADVLLQELRSRIDSIDDELLNLLAQRSEISSKIGIIKKEHNLAVLQLDRWNSILSNHIEKGKSIGLNDNLVREIFEAIHKDSIDRQL